MKDYIDSFNEAGFSVLKKNGRIIISSPRMTIIGQSDNTLWTAKDILCSECYGFASTEKFIALDIGQNIGIASLYFACSEKILHVYGFEPFPETFFQAQVNFTNNPNLSKKITSFNFGLGKENSDVEVHYNKNLPGSMSTSRDIFPEGELQRVEIKNVSEVLNTILQKHTEKVFCKIDCEGAEKEIVPSLEMSGLLHRIHVLMMEWHFSPPKSLIDILTGNGFTVFFDHSVRDKLGFIKAVRV